MATSRSSGLHPGARYAMRIALSTKSAMRFISPRVAPVAAWTPRPLITVDRKRYHWLTVIEDQPIEQPVRPLFMQPYPGYWRTKGKLERMRRLQDLIRHYENWSGDIDLAQPLEKLLPKVPRTSGPWSSNKK